MCYTVIMKNEKVLMIIVKQRISKPVDLPKEMKCIWTEEPGDEAEIVDQHGQVVAKTRFEKGDEFPGERIKLAWECQPGYEQVLAHLAGVMAKLYDEMPGRYPLYTEMKGYDLEVIKTLARIGFTPYLGEYEGCSEEKNKEIWQQVTDALRKSEEE